GDSTSATWASDNGNAAVFQPVTPTVTSPHCDSPQFTGFGSGLVLAEGGVAFYRPTTGWYVHYPSLGAPPEWLNSYDDSLKSLRKGAYLRIRRDGASCSRSVELIGSTGQLCATLSLDGSDDCNTHETISPEGTVALQDGCSIRWWPKLAQ